MSHANTESNLDGNRPTSARVSLLLAEVAIIAVATWAFLRYGGFSESQVLLNLILKPVSSATRLTLIVGFGGILLSVPLLKRRGQKTRTHQVFSPSPTQPARGKLHPLMLTQRPSRDPNFVIRKTKKRGKLSRNRSGERLPANIPE